MKKQLANLLYKSSFLKQGHPEVKAEILALESLNNDLGKLPKIKLLNCWKQQNKEHIWFETLSFAKFKVRKFNHLKNKIDTKNQFVISILNFILIVEI